MSNKICVTRSMVEFLMALCIGEGIEYGRYENERKKTEPIQEFKERLIKDLLSAAGI